MMPSDQRREVLELRRALMSLGGPAQAQRHHARVGLLQSSCRALEDVRRRLPELELAGTIDTAQASQVRAVVDALVRLHRAWTERMPAESERAGFDFLWSDAFEDPEWGAVRQLARSAFTIMRESDSPLVG
jgi:hypothetical protein